VDHPRRVVEVIHCVDHLPEVETRIIFGEAASQILLLNEGKEVALFYELKHNEKYLNCAARVGDHELSLDVPVDQFDNVIVLNILQETDLVVQNLLESGQRQPLNVVPFNNFDGYEFSSPNFLCKFHSKTSRAVLVKPYN
jgi:hypothetical protein